MCPTNAQALNTRAEWTDAPEVAILAHADYPIPKTHGSVMDKFIVRENLALFRRRLADPNLTQAERNVLLTLLTEEHLRGGQKRSFDPCQSAGGKTPLLASGSQPGELS